MRDGAAAALVRVSPPHPVAVVVGLAAPVARDVVLLEGAVADVPALRRELPRADLGVHHHLAERVHGVAHRHAQVAGADEVEGVGRRLGHRGQ